VECIIQEYKYIAELVRRIIKIIQSSIKVSLRAVTTAGCTVKGRARNGFKTKDSCTGNSTDSAVRAADWELKHVQWE
jgi:hypothetical protein